MSLTNDFEHVHASLLHRSPLPTLDQAITELLSEETHLAPRKPTPINVAFTTVKGPQSNNKDQSYGSSNKICNYCKKPGHVLLECPIRVCQFCHKEAPGHLQRDCFQNPNRYSQQYTSHGTSSRVTATTTKGSSSTAPIEKFSASKIEQILKQVLVYFGNPPSLSVTQDNSSWFFDSACCSHITPGSTLFPTKRHDSYTPSIQTTNGSLMTVTHIGTISILNTSLPDTYCIPRLTLNLKSVRSNCLFHEEWGTANQ